MAKKIVAEVKEKETVAELNEIVNVTAEMPEETETITEEVPDTDVTLDLPDDIRMKLDAQPKVTVFIRSEEKCWYGAINGYDLIISTNRPVQVPRDVAKLIYDSARVQKECDAALMKYTIKGGVKLAEM